MPSKELLHAYHESRIPGKQRQPSWNILRSELLKICKENTVFLILDALDECENRDEILSFLCGLEQEKANIKLLTTSREEADIAQSCGQATLRLKMENHRRDVDRDVEAYVGRRLAHDPRLKKLAQAVQDEIRNSLNEKSAGMYVVIDLGV